MKILIPVLSTISLLMVFFIEKTCCVEDCSQTEGSCYDDRQCCQGHCYRNLCFNEGNCDTGCKKGYNCIEQQAFCIPEITCPPSISTCSPAYNQSEPCPFCEDGQVCKLIKVQCIQSPCPPIPQCTMIEGDPDCNQCKTGQVCEQSNCKTPPCSWKCQQQ